jgi:hypothetical protein
MPAHRVPDRCPGYAVRQYHTTTSPVYVCILEQLPEILLVVCSLLLTQEEEVLTCA